MLVVHWGARVLHQKLIHSLWNHGSCWHSSQLSSLHETCKPLFILQFPSSIPPPCLTLFFSCRRHLRRIASRTLRIMHLIFVKSTLFLILSPLSFLYLGLKASYQYDRHCNLETGNHTESQTRWLWCDAALLQHLDIEKKPKFCSQLIPTLSLYPHA